MVHTEELQIETKGFCDIVNITDPMHETIEKSGFHHGSITAFCPGATGGITTIEYEPGLLKDLPELFEKLIPSDRSYHHDDTWHDGNGFSHLRSALVGPEVTVPFIGGKMTLGTWQQVVFLDFDNRPRQRKLVLHVMGE